MARWRQLRLLLWKDYLIRRRNFITLAGVLWASGIMFAIYIVRININNEDVPTCQFPARALPSAGLLPFLQSFICSVSNECSPMDQFEEIPSYEKAKFTQMQRKLSPLLNESVLELASSVPDGVRLLATLADIADEPTFRDFSKNGLKFQDLFNNPSRVKRYVISHLALGDDVAQSLMASRISFQGLLNGNFDRCKKESLSQTLIVQNGNHLEIITNKLCAMTKEDLQKMFMDLMQYINFNKYVKMLGNMYYKLAGDDRIAQLGDFLTAMLRLTKPQHFLPPEAISLFFRKQPDFSYLKLDLIPKFVTLFQPTFGETKEFQSIKEFTDMAVMGLQYMNKVFGDLSTNDTRDEITDLVLNNVEFKLDPKGDLDKINTILNNAVGTFENSSDKSIDTFNVLSQIMKTILKFLSNNYKHDVLLYTTMLSKLMEGALQIIDVNMHLQETVYNATLRHPQAIKILRDLPPSIVGKAFEALVSAERTQILTSNLNDPGQLFCNVSMLQSFLLITKSDVDSVKSLLCSDAWTNYISDLIKSFGVFDVKDNINDIASLLIQETLGKDTSSQLYPIEKDLQILKNFTRTLVTMDAEITPEFDWQNLLEIKNDSKLMEEIRKKAHLGKLMLISVHGALAKEIVKQNTILHYKIAPILLDATTLITSLNDHLETIPAAVSEGLKRNYGDIIRTMLSTALVEEKTFKSLSTYCEDMFCHGGANAATYLNIPDGIDVDAMTSTLCNASVAIENGLKADSEISKAINKIRTTTHTLLEDVDWTKIISSLQKLYMKLDEDYPYVFEFATYGMDNSTQNELQHLFGEAKVYWFSVMNLHRSMHLSIKLGFRLLDILDRGIFNMTNDIWVKFKFVTSSTLGPLRVLDDIVKQITGLLTNSSHISNLPPITSAALRRIAPNLPQMIIDAINVIIEDDTPIEPIIALMNADPAWPCSSNSLSEHIQVSDTSKDGIIAMETLMCMEANLQDEWIVYLEERKARIDKSLTWNTTSFDPHLFLKFSSILDSLINDTLLIKDVLNYIVNGSTVGNHVGLKTAWNYAVDSINTADRNIILRKFLNKFDMVLNSINTSTIQANVSMNALWEKYVKCGNGSRIEGECRKVGRAAWVYTMKMLSVIFESIAIDLTTYFTEVNEPNSNLLQVFGFTRGTSLYMLYEKLPEFIGVLLNSYWDYGFMIQVRRASLTQFWDCEAVASALVPPPDSSIQYSDIHRIKPYMCPSFIYWLSLPRDDNILFNLVAKPQYYFYSLHVQNATSNYESAFTKATDLAEYITHIAKKNNTAGELEMNTMEHKLATFIDKILNYKINISDPSYTKFNEIVNKQFVSNIYLTKVVAITNKISMAINNITFDATTIEFDDIEINKINAELKIVKNIFRRKAVDAIAMFYDVLTDLLWTNNDNYTFVDALDSMCQDLKNNNQNKTILVDETRTKAQLCAKNYKILFGSVKDIISDDYDDARVSLMNLVNVLQDANSSDIMDIYDFLKSNEHQMNSLKQSIKYAYELGLPVYLKYLQSNLQSYNVVLSFLSGNDWWNELRVLYNGPQPQKFFGYLENSFDITSDFLTHLDEVHLVRLIREMNLNDSDSFCRPNISLGDYIPDSTHALSELKQQICSTDKVALFKEIPPLLFASQGYENSLSVSKEIDYSALNQDIANIRVKLDLLKEGPKVPSRPPWATEERIQSLRKDLLQLVSKDTLMKIAFGIVSNAVDGGTLFLNDSQCRQCSQLTSWFKQLNLQLFKKQEYDALLCHMHHMTLEEIYNTLKNDFHWDMFIKELISTRNYTKFELNKSMTEFLGLVKSHLLEDTAVSTTKLTGCLAGNVTRNSFGTTALILKVLAHTTKLLQAEAPYFHKIEGIKQLEYLQKLSKQVSHNLDAYVDVEEYVIDGRDLNNELKKVLADDKFTKEVLTSDVNLKVVLNPASSEGLLKLLSNKGKLICEDHNCSEIYDVILNNLNQTRIAEDLPSLQVTEYWRFPFISSILNHTEALLSHTARLAGVASLVDVRKVMEGKLEALVDLMLKILMDDTFDSIVYSLQGVIQEFHPLLKDTPLEGDLKALNEGLKIFHQFKTYMVKEGDLKLEVSKLFSHPDAMEAGITALGINNTNFWSLAAPRIYAGHMQLKPVLSPKEPYRTISEWVCQMDAMSEVLVPGDVGLVTADDVSAATVEQFCGLPDHTVKDLLMVLATNLNFELIIDKIKEHVLTKLYSASHLTPEQGETVLQRFPRMAALLPSLQNNLEDVMKTLDEEPLFQSLKDFSSIGKLLGSSDFMSNVGTMLCGKPFKTDMSRYLRTIINMEDQSSEVSQEQLDVLPTDFCRSLYQEIISIEGGKIVWSFVKPLIMGKILYTPKHPTVERIMETANSTFASMVQMTELVHSFADAFPSLNSITSHREGLNALQHLLKSPGMEQLRNTLLGGDFNVDIDVEGMLDKVGDLKGIGSLLSKASDLLRCVNLNRFLPTSDEQQLMLDAARLMTVNEFSAGVVFLNVDELDNSLRNVEYKIRMDIENAPTTKWMKPYLWTPGPDASFIENMRYFRGFIQIQDLLDKAIIKLSSESSRKKREITEVMDWAVYTQQEPYPCYRKDFFQTSLYESQSLIVAFFFAFLFTVASAVRFIVADKESGNTMLMSVMGVDLAFHSLSWFLASLLEMIVTVGVVTIVLKWGNVLPRTDATLVFTLLVLFGISVLSFCYLMSKLFSNASFAAVCTGIAYLITFMPFVMILSLEAVMDSSLKLFVCLSMSSSLLYSFLYIARYEMMGVGAHWSHLWDSPNEDSMSIGYATIMIVFDALLYFAIGYCIDRYFGFKTLKSSITNCTTLEEKAGVSIVNVSKVYGEGSRRQKLALDNVSMELRKGQITTLLGHNGAGKTTLINILTGMLRPTKGSIIVRSAERGRPQLGVCPQKNVLFEYMTPREHITLYAQLKSGLEAHEVQDEVERMLRVLSLGAVAERAARALSGGQRRRVCVALAFVARPALVSLDEPTAGVDPAARREIWSMIVKLKEDRTILLTTHHLDEAELLSDQIVIMHRGQIHTTGSPIEIKRTLGTGYNLTLTLPERASRNWDDSLEEKSKQLLTAVRGVVKNAVVGDVSDGQVPQVEIALPFYDDNGGSNNFLQLCTVLEQGRSALGFSSFSMDCTSLEQVFFDICQRADSINMSPQYEEQPSKSASTSSVRSDSAPLVEEDGALRGSRLQQFVALMQARYLHHIRNKWLLFMLLVLPSLFVSIAMAFSTMRPPADNEIALRLTGALYPHTTQYIVPNPSDYSEAIDPTFAQHIMNQLKSDKKARQWNLKDTPNCKCVDTSNKCEVTGNLTQLRPEVMIVPDVATLNTWIVNTHDIFIEKRYGGYTSTLKNNKTNLIAWYNNKGHHAMPAYVNALNNAILRAVAGNNRNITAYSHPLKISKEQISKDTVYQHIADAGISALVLVAYCLASAGAAVYLVSARTRQEKRLQLLCGVSPALYWAAALAWDMAIIAINMLLTAVVMWSFGFPVFVLRNNLPAICILIMLYGFACGSLVHLTEKLFTEASLANMMLFCGNAFLGLAGIVLLIILDIISESERTDNARWVLHKVLLLLPQFALGDGLLEVAKNTISAQVLGRFGLETYRDPLASSLLAPHYGCLLAVGATLALANLALEYGYFEWLVDRFSSTKLHALLERDTPEPEEVAAERRAVEASIAQDSMLPTVVSTIGNINRGLVHGAACVRLGKVYGGVLGGAAPHAALKDLTLRLPPGECTVLLGENGAGKSTTFAILCGETRPSRGHVRLHATSRSTGADPRELAAGHISYCPQSDAIDPLLTVTETLQIYCRLRGITDQDEVIKRTLEMFSLCSYGGVRSGALSGGNRRKLCTALAFMGRAPLVLLDEPTSGMDPVSRQCVSRGVRAARRRGVLLATHSLADGRRLAARAALLRRGELAALLPLHACLTRFGGGWEVACRGARGGRAAWRGVAAAAPHARLLVLHQTQLHFLVPAVHTVDGKEIETRLSDVFRLLATLQALGDIEDYTLNQSSLEQMFLSFTDKAKVTLDSVDVEKIPSSDTIRRETPDTIRQESPDTSRQESPDTIRRNSEQLDSVTSL